MPSGELLKRLLRSYVGRQDDAFVAAARQIIASERRQGHKVVADELSRILANGLRGQPETANGTRSLPLARGEQQPLVNVRRPVSRLSDIILTESCRRRVDRVLEEFAKREALAHHGLLPRTKLLFYGPPGCGKTLCAEVLASELGLPLFYARFDSIISSYLGETASNLRRVFDFAAAELCVLFFDEFDAIGKSRDDREEVGELKRVVNSYLQLMDNFTGGGLVIAATNHERLLDNALWRRFDDAIHFPMPTREGVEALLKLRLSAIRRQDFAMDAFIEELHGLSYGDITRICTEAIKLAVLRGQSGFSAGVFRSSLEEFKTAQQEMSRSLGVEKTGEA